MLMTVKKTVKKVLMSVKKSENNVEKWEKWKNEKPLNGRCGGETLIRRLYTYRMCYKNNNTYH